MFTATAFNSTELNSASETKSCSSRATVEPAKHGSSTTFETGLNILLKSMLLPRETQVVLHSIQTCQCVNRRTIGSC